MNRALPKINNGTVVILYLEFTSRLLLTMYQHRSRNTHYILNNDLVSDLNRDYCYLQKRYSINVQKMHW